LIFGICFWQVKNPVGTNFQTDFNVKQGDGIDEIANELSEKGIIRSSFLFKTAAFLKDGTKGILPGYYRLNSNMNTLQVLNIFISNDIVDNKVLIIEGWRKEQIALVLKEKGIDGNGFLSEIKNVSKYEEKFPYLKKFEPLENLEGFLFPDTYQFTKDNTAQDVVEEMLENFNLKVIQKTDFSKNDYFANPYDVIKLASIIEREIFKSSDRPSVAGLYINRLKKNMKLQADPTVQYQKDTRSNILKASNYWGKITSADYLKWSGDFNTYLIKGLPKTPICNPGFDAINSVIEYASNQYFYVFNDSKGNIYFSKTYAEHLNQQKNEWNK
jgi:UPF0755 protein